MASDHFLPWFVGDFMASTATWTGPERGLYIQLLGIQWSAGSLPSDLVRLARAVNYTIDEFQALWPIMASKFGNGDGKLTNSRLEKIRTYNAQVQEARKSKAKAAAEARWHPSMPQALLKQSSMQSSMHVSEPNRSDPIRTVVEPTKKLKATRKSPRELPEWFIEFKSIFPRRAGDPDWAGGLRAARARISEGHDPKEFIEGARRYAAFITATGKTGTEFIKQASQFLGPGKPFSLPWNAPAEPESDWDAMMRLNGGKDDGPGRVFENTEPSGTALEASVRLVRSG